MTPIETITRFDRFLKERDLRLEAVVIGGAALALLGVVARPTKDCDILHPELSHELQVAAAEFAAGEREHGNHLEDDWLNNGPASLADVLPSGWEERLQSAFAGESIILRSLGRLDLLRSKVFALCDRGIDLQDCVALAPTDIELTEISPWLSEQDGNPGWPSHVDAVLTDLSKRLGRGV